MGSAVLPLQKHFPQSIWVGSGFMFCCISSSKLWSSEGVPSPGNAVCVCVFRSAFQSFSAKLALNKFQSNI